MSLISAAHHVLEVWICHNACWAMLMVGGWGEGGGEGVTEWSVRVLDQTLGLRSSPLVTLQSPAQIHGYAYVNIHLFRL